MTWYEIAQAWIAGATLPVTGYFIFLLAKPSERWWVTWFGRSLMLLAIGVLFYSAATVLYRTTGDYPLRPGLLLIATTSVLVAMTIRTVVLHTQQREDRRMPLTHDDPKPPRIIRKRARHSKS